MLLGYVPHSNCIFLSNIETMNISQVSQNVKDCVNITELTQCGVLTTVTHISSSTIPSLTSSISSSVITVIPIPTIPSTTMPIAIIIGVPVGLILVLTILVAILIIVLLCAKFGIVSRRKKKGSAHTVKIN